MVDKKESAASVTAYQAAIENRVTKATGKLYTCGCGGGRTIVWEPSRRMFVCTACGYVDKARTRHAKYGKDV